MRATIRQQLPLTPVLFEEDARTKALKQASALLDELPAEVYARVLQDVTGDASAECGRGGMSADQIVRAGYLRRRNDESYTALAHRLADSRSARWFCRLGFGQRISRSTLHENLSRVSDTTWEAINTAIVQLAEEKGVEDRKRARTDTTPVKGLAHEPTDSSLLWDGCRVVCRLLEQARQAGFEVEFRDRRRAAKRQHMAIFYAKRQAQRLPHYKELLKIADQVVEDGTPAADLLRTQRLDPKRGALAGRLVKALDDTLKQLCKVQSQTRRRLFQGESVPAGEKVLSIFEPHIDLLRKGLKVDYGHKVTLTSGVSGLFLDCKVEAGNPADSTLAVESVRRQRAKYGDVPAQVAFDGGFASQENVRALKAEGVEDVCFSKRCGLEITDMARDKKLFQQLKRFRAGIEAGISRLKRCFGFARCTDRGEAAFKAYAQAAVFAGNLSLLARLVGGGGG